MHEHNLLSFLSWTSTKVNLTNKLSQTIHRKDLNNKNKVYILYLKLEIHACNNPSPLFKRCILSAQPSSQGFRMRTTWETRKPWSGPVNFAFWLANTILSKNNWTWQLTITIQVICIFMILMCTSMFCKIILQSKTFSRLHDLLSPRPVTKLKSRVDVSWDVSLTKQEFETSTII
jgi:hypothetical protein